jgi:hypothetical protein
MASITRSITRRNAIISGSAYAYIYWPGGLFAQKKPAFDAGYAAWDALLKKHVKWLPDNRQSRVSYAGFAADRDKIRAKGAELVYLDYDWSLNDAGR